MVCHSPTPGLYGFVDGLYKGALRRHYITSLLIAVAKYNPAFDMVLSLAYH